MSPPKVGAQKERPAKPTAFRKFYDRGDFPIALEHDTKGNKIAWKVIWDYWARTHIHTLTYILIHTHMSSPTGSTSVISVLTIG